MLSDPNLATRESLDRGHGTIDSIARKQAPAEPSFRAPPHNIEAEQPARRSSGQQRSVLTAFSDFLEPKHFFEPSTQRIFELAGGLIRAQAKLATPVTLKTFLPR